MIKIFFKWTTVIEEEIKTYCIMLVICNSINEIKSMKKVRESEAKNYSFNIPEYHRSSSWKFDFSFWFPPLWQAAFWPTRVLLGMKFVSIWTNVKQRRLLKQEFLLTREKAFIGCGFWFMGINMGVRTFEMNGDSHNTMANQIIILQRVCESSNCCRGT